MNNSRDNTFTFQFSDTLEIGEMLVGLSNGLDASTGTLKVFEVGDVSGDISTDLAGTAIFSETWTTVDTTFSTTIDGNEVGTLVLDFSSALTVDDRSTVSGTAGYAFQFDFDSGSFNVSNRTSGVPSEFASYYRNDGSNDYTSPFGSNGYQLGFVAIPEPSSFALLAGALGLALVMLRRRRA